MSKRPTTDYSESITMVSAMSKENMSVKVRQTQETGRHADAGLLQAGKNQDL